MAVTQVRPSMRTTGRTVAEVCRPDQPVAWRQGRSAAVAVVAVLSCCHRLGELMGGHVSRIRSLLQHGIAAILGAATVFVLASRLLPAWSVAAAFAVSFILLLPKKPWLVAAFCGGAALVMITWSVMWSFADWNCASDVNGAIVEHDCGEPSPSNVSR